MVVSLIEEAPALSSVPSRTLCVRSTEQPCNQQNILLSSFLLLLDASIIADFFFILFHWILTMPYERCFNHYVNRKQSPRVVI